MPGLSAFTRRSKPKKSSSTEPPVPLSLQSNTVYSISRKQSKEQGSLETTIVDIQVSFKPSQIVKTISAPLSIVASTASQMIDSNLAGGAVAIGYTAGQYTQGIRAIAIGAEAGFS